MANQTGILRGRLPNGKAWDLTILVVDTDVTLSQFADFGTGTVLSMPSDVVFYDFTIPANTATITRLVVVKDGVRTAKRIATAAIANFTTDANTRIGGKFRMPKGSQFQLIGLA